MLAIRAPKTTAGAQKTQIENCWSANPENVLDKLTGAAYSRTGGMTIFVSDDTTVFKQVVISESGASAVDSAPGTPA
jgi:hypothetical protein